MSKRIFCTSDTHGCAKALYEVLCLANFDFENDRLIHLGDCVDRGPNSFGVIEILLNIKDLIAVRGNHDDCLLDFINTGTHGLGWTHGGEATRTSYAKQNMQLLEDLDIDRQDYLTSMFIPKTHIEFFRNQLRYYVDDENRLFVHAGFNKDRLITDQIDEILYWDRHFFMQARSAGKKGKLKDVNDFKRIFIGHTPTISVDRNIVTPMYMAQVVAIDTGAPFGTSGRLSLLDITDDNNHILYQV